MLALVPGLFDRHSEPHLKSSLFQIIFFAANGPLYTLVKGYMMDGRNLETIQGSMVNNVPSRTDFQKAGQLSAMPC